MKFKNIESEWKIRSAAQCAAKNYLDNALGYGQTTGPIIQAVTDAIGAAVQVGIKIALEELYTDEDFERDLTLKP